MIEDVWKEEIKKVVRKYLPPEDYEVFIFGSRAAGGNLKFSDVDVGVRGKNKISGHLKVLIEEELENSRIPYQIDLVDFNRVSKSFKNLALRDIISL